MYEVPFWGNSYSTYTIIFQLIPGGWLVKSCLGTFRVVDAGISWKVFHYAKCRTKNMLKGVW